MAFEKIRENTDELQDRVKELFDANVAYYKLFGFKIAMKGLEATVKYALFAIAVLFTVLFFSIALALTIGNAMDSFALGFLIVGVIYLIFGFLALKFSSQLFQGSIMKKFSRKVLNKF
ncbi:competence protein [Flavobacterium sp. NST-5]|uniref:Competence protein n=1 Tax=Flavobacterium ichthyis TaxID=2698827 RepID=A0ABW9ZF97_9FLAO|nr:competence protein [Flavobacterium ichthyis]NBL65760.1 competence protein [Flavobacterium ichthyis]